MAQDKDESHDAHAPKPQTTASSSPPAKRKRSESPPAKRRKAKPMAETPELASGSIEENNVDVTLETVPPLVEQTPLEDGELSPPLPDEQPPPLPDEQPPPLPDEQAPPLPDGVPQPSQPEDDGWAPVWDDTNQAFYFFNRFTQATQWDNPRVPQATSTTTIDTGPPGVDPISLTSTAESLHPAVAGGYNPAIHGSYDPNADYANMGRATSSEADAFAALHDAGNVSDAQDPTAAADYAAVGTFNRFTGRFQHATLAPENFNDENKSRRQMSAFFDVDSAANSHDGRSLKAERANKKLSKKEVKEFREKRRERKEEKRRAWLRD